ncbi:hypothetical protein EJ03DRAFT_327252 [Teratosphaeria nubilosa]|uniref:DNA/RNA-binding protein Alba-like domain-containing protein n=1 Tax=Teratosphaeria nubilosa TaxID=161662 RepID=A0A6G1L9X2_9PEZI|nr:hypothetical protein EJ03DRAFT_327252 [Teratosphaeria nubilosa]
MIAPYTLRTTPTHSPATPDANASQLQELPVLRSGRVSQSSFARETNCRRVAKSRQELFSTRACYHASSSNLNASTSNGYMAIDGNDLLTRFTVITLSVHQSSQISDRTSKIISKLGGAGEKPVLVCMKAKSKAASKLISIVEIARRELKTRNVRCYQYNVLTSELVDVPRDPKKQSCDDQVNGNEDNDGSDAAFETMGAPMGDTKKRNVPLMTVYLSQQPVRELRNQYGEQS